MTDVEKHFPDYMTTVLKKYNFTTKEGCYNAAVFGDAYIIAENENIALRFVKDRSQFFVNLRSLEEKTWHRLIRTFQYLNIPTDNSLDIFWQIKTFEENYSALCGIFLNKAEHNRLDVFEQKENEKVMDKIFSKNRKKQE